MTLRLQEIDTLKTINFLQDSLILLKANEIKSLSKIVDIKTVEDQEKQQRIEELTASKNHKIINTDICTETRGNDIYYTIVVLYCENKGE